MTYKIAISNFPDKLERKHYRALRLMGKIPLEDVYQLAQYARGLPFIVIASGLTEKVAKCICSALVKSGLNARVSECQAKYPMVLCPSLSHTYKLSFGFIKKASS